VDFEIAKYSLVGWETGLSEDFRHGSLAPETPPCRSFYYTRSHVIIGRLAAWCARCGHGCRTKWTGILSLNPAFEAIYVKNMITGQVSDPISFFQGYKANNATGSRVIFVVGGLINLRRCFFHGMIGFGLQKKLAGRRTVSSRSCLCIVIPEIPYPTLLNQSLLQHSIDQHVICSRKAAIDTIGNGMTSLVGKT
jgi:hypothetical protein